MEGKREEWREGGVGVVVTLLSPLLPPSPPEPQTSLGFALPFPRVVRFFLCFFFLLFQVVGRGRGGGRGREGGKRAEGEVKGGRRGLSLGGEPLSPSPKPKLIGGFLDG